MISSAQIAIVRRLIEIGDWVVPFTRAAPSKEQATEWADLRAQLDALDALGGIEE